MTIRPRYPCVIIHKTNEYDEFGRPKLSVQRRRTKCDVVYFREGVERTTVREDSSASRSKAEEFSHDVRLMLMPRENITLGDVIELSSFGEPGDRMSIEIQRVHRRIDVTGRVHHIEVDGNRFSMDET